ncbi:hypothetical protein BD309DRAFT_866206 [Dichomitus squalens]|uniref:Uncharacterized protein n=1 Tax=Dichomitus squalens TaxID=114155 RepID=A0A4Q9PX32_9APHY|nr:hypothetical protein BD309DRAFT_866206 [Dichomitus squalens]TBU58934.1 hypothetical protein BD310DRAFT_818384 [Dichomitus squalens]
MIRDRNPLLSIICAQSEWIFLDKTSLTASHSSLMGKGVDVSENGLSVKTDKKLDREQYLDATQRGFIKAFNASSGGNRSTSEGAKETPRGKRRFRKRA